MGGGPPVLGVPKIRPEAVADHIPVEVVKVGFGCGREKEAAGGSGDDIGVRTILKHANVRELQPRRTISVIRHHLAPEILPLATHASGYTLRSPQRHGSIAVGGAEHVRAAGDRPLRILVKVVHGVVFVAKVGTPLVAPAVGSLAISDVVEVVLELLSGHRRTVVPVFLARLNLSEAVVIVHPIGVVFARRAGALVGAVVAVGVRTESGGDGVRRFDGGVKGS